jgi:hypothetical protein
MRICSVEWCVEYYYCKGFCKFHYKRNLNGTDLNKPRMIKTKVTDLMRENGCKVSGCGGEYKLKGYCGMHYHRHKKGIPFDAVTQSDSPEKRLLSRVKKGTGPNGDCWEYPLSKGRRYGSISVNGKYVPAHRFSWEFHNKKKMDSKLYALHSCDNGACVNPDHIRPGTQKENVRDMIERGRNVPLKGEKNASCKINNEIALNIYKEAGKGIKYKLIMAKYNVKHSVVSAIKNGRAWSHITGHQKKIRKGRGLVNG